MSQTKCSKCSKTVEANNTRKIDGHTVCLNCLYDAVEPISFRPIGFVANDKRRRAVGFGTTGGDISEIRLLPYMQHFMKGIEDESRLLILWHIHQARDIKTVFRRGWDGKRVGPFASRTPDRLTPIGVTEVELLRVEGATLVVRGLDAVDGTPVLDIKVAVSSLKKRKDSP